MYQERLIPTGYKFENGMQKAVSGRFSVLIAAALLLLFFGVNLVALNRFPPFIDETVHIRTGELVLQNFSPLEGINLGRQFTILWFALFQPAASDAIWVARAATLIAALVGLAAVMGIARLAAGTWGMIFAALLYSFNSYHYFYGRLALADPVSGAAVLAALYFAYRLSRRAAWQDAALCGICLFLAVGAKINSIPYYGIPVAAALSLTPAVRRLSLPGRIRWLAAALGCALGLFGAFVIGARLRGLDFLSNSFSLALSARGPFDTAAFFSPERIAGNVMLTLDSLGVLWGLPALALLVAAVIVLIVRRHFFLPLCLIAPALALWINLPQEMRFFVVPAAIALLCGAVVLGHAARRSRLVAAVALTVLAAWALTLWLPFALTAAETPADIPLPPVDARQYTRSDASGFGFDAIGDTLRGRDVQLVIGALANCQGMRYHLRDLPISCPTIRPDGQDSPALADLFAANRRAGVYVVLEDSPYVPESAPGQVAAMIDVPPGKPALTLYDLAP